MNYEELKQRQPAELRQILTSYGVKAHPRMGADKLAKLLMETVANKQQTEAQKAVQKKQEQPDLQHPAQKAKPALVIHTPDEVDQVIAAQLAKPGFTAEYPGDDTWIFKCRGAEESGHMSCPLRVIKQKAESVSFGARKARGMLKNEEGHDVFNAQAL